MDTDIEILKTALCSAGDAAALARVRERADAIRAAIGDDDIALAPEQSAHLAANAEWVVEVYAALAGDMEHESQSDIDAAIAEMIQDELREIGDAFGALAESLQESGYDWTARFEGLPAPDEFTLGYLREDGSVEAGGVYAERLLDFGLTPAMIYGATRGVYLQFASAARSMADPAGARASLEDAAFCISGPQRESAWVSRDLVLAGIADTRDMPESAVEPVFDWINDVLPLHPFLVEGYVWEGRLGAIGLLSPVVEDRPPDLVAQWARGQLIGAASWTGEAQPMSDA
jgi:hypothetical protein